VRKLVLLFCLLWLSLHATAAPARKMLVLYKSSEKINPNDYEVKWHIEPILVPQGWKLAYLDCDKGLPDEAAMAEYQGVCSWHRTAVYKDPSAYVRWMRNQVVSGRKVIVFGNFGAFTSDQKTWLGNEVLNEFFLPFGLEYGAAYSGDTKQLQVVGSSKATPPSPLSYYLLFRSINPDNDPWLTVSRKDLDKSESAMVAVTPHGCMVGETYAYQMDGKKVRWLVDRSKLLAEATATPSGGDRVSSGGHLLALYKSSEGFDDATNYIARFLAGPLKELGYTFDCYDILKGPPPAASMSKYTGVISWYQTASMENAAAYCNWLSQQIMAGRKVVVVGNLGAFQELDSKSNPPTERWLLPNEYNSFLYPFGLEFKGMWTKDPALLRVSSRDQTMIPFLEQQYITHYYWIQAVSPEDKPYLVINRSDAKNSDSAIVVRTPYGGLALESYLFRDMTGKGDYKWHVDMKRFLADCLTYKPSKLPVASTLKWTPTPPRQVSGADSLPKVAGLPAGTIEIKRRVLAFYQRDQKEESGKNRIHDNVETFLNHIGLVVDYRAIEDSLPSTAEMEQYRGIITWFLGASVPDAQAYGSWLKAQIEAGRKLVIVGDYGAYQDKNLATQVDPSPTFKALGIDWRAASPVSGIRLNRTNLVTMGPPSVEFMDESMCKGEHPINLADNDLKKGWPVYLSSNPANKVYLKVKDPEGQICDAVTVTPNGGIVAGEFLLYVPPAMPLRVESSDPNRSGPAVADEIEVPELRIDAFRFFAEAFQTNDLPRCDTTTLNGSRIFFTHIDGDAMQGMSLIDRGSLNAEMLYREIFQNYQIPTSVSFVTDNLQFKATPTYKRELEAARRILALPWVEADCHTVNHPFNWRLGDLKRKPGDNEGGLVRLPPDNRLEICDAIDFTNQLVCPPGKSVKTLFWSGMCNPSEEALRYTDGMGCSNLNGGDPVYDSIHPYLVGVSPLYAQVDGRYQFHTCAAGDFYYTGAWTKDYDGMKRLVEYFNYTEEPRRLRAMNLYYHFYLAERELGISGLKIAMDWVMDHKPAYLFASNYVDIVRDMIVTRLGRDAQGNIVVSNSGAMRTIRFDDLSKRPDLSKSSGVLGYNTAGNRLYVHLDDATVHRIALADNPANNRPYVERASHYINGWKAGGSAVSFNFKGTGPASFSLLGMDKNAGYRVSLQGQPDKVVRSDGSGRLSWDGTLANYEGTYSVKVNKQ
jgi:hypothetical protein